LGVKAPLERRRILDRLLNTNEVAAILGVSPRTVKRLLARGLPCVRLGRSIRVSQRDLERFVAARRE
jgi:excisionase family DNA binding protein